MINLDPDHLLFIHPKHKKASIPVVDHLVRTMERAIAASSIGNRWRGWHSCVCGERSTAFDYVLPSGQVTNSLAVHYLECHREEVPISELEKVEKLSGCIDIDLSNG